MLISFSNYMLYYKCLPCFVNQVLMPDNAKQSHDFPPDDLNYRIAGNMSL